jgi:hypothetical protein
MSRIHLLSSKLLHSSHSVRIRAATNLIFKVKSDLLDNDPECVIEIFNKINLALSAACSANQDSKEFVSLVLDLAVCILTRYSDVKSLAGLANITATQAFRLSNEDILDSDKLDKLNVVGLSFV